MAPGRVTWFPSALLPDAWSRPVGGLTSVGHGASAPYMSAVKGRRSQIRGVSGSRRRSCRAVRGGLAGPPQEQQGPGPRDHRPHLPCWGRARWTSGCVFIPEAAVHFRFLTDFQVRLGRRHVRSLSVRQARERWISGRSRCFIWARKLAVLLFTSSLLCSCFKRDSALECQPWDRAHPSRPPQAPGPGARGACVCLSCCWRPVVVSDGRVASGSRLSA